MSNLMRFAWTTFCQKQHLRRSNACYQIARAAFYVGWTEATKNKFPPSASEQEGGDATEEQGKSRHRDLEHPSSERRREQVADAIALVLKETVPNWNDAQVAYDCAIAALSVSPSSERRREGTQAARRIIDWNQRAASSAAVNVVVTAKFIADALEVARSLLGPPPSERRRELEEALADALIDYIRAPYSRSWLVNRINIAIRSLPPSSEGGEEKTDG